MQRGETREPCFYGDDDRTRHLDDSQTPAENYDGRKRRPQSGAQLTTVRRVSICIASEGRDVA